MFFRNLPFIVVVMAGCGGGRPDSNVRDLGLPMADGPGALDFATGAADLASASKDLAATTSGDMVTPPDLRMPTDLRPVADLGPAPDLFGSTCSTGGNPCTSTNPCHLAAVSCATGVAVCVDNGNKPDGTACGTNQVCNQGTCMPCTSGISCAPANACHGGTTSCSTGATTCVDSGSALPNGSACGSGMFCNAGTCGAFVLAVTTGDGQTAFPDQSLQPVTLKLVDGTANPVVGVTVTAAPPPGGVGQTAVTDAQGAATVSLRLGRTIGAESFTATAPGASTVVSATATAPSATAIFTAMNAPHAVGTRAATTGPATMALGGQPHGVAAESDGTLYVADYNYAAIYQISPAGDLTIVAGTGTPGYSGDGMVATGAQVNQPTAIALDSASHLIYFVDQFGTTIRSINLSTGVIHTAAGGGTAGAPAYGDGGPATSASLYNVSSLAVAPDHTLYIIEAGRNRIRHVLSDGTITTWLIAAGNCDPVSNGLAAVTTSCSMAWDPAGHAFVAAQVCAGSVATAGVARVVGGNQLVRVAGHPGAVTTPMGDALEASFVSGGSIAFDGAGNLFMLDFNRLYKIDAGTRTVTLLAGGATVGSSGDYGPGTSALLNTPLQIALDGAGNAYVADSRNDAIRVVWNVASSRASVALVKGTGDGQTVFVDQLAQPMSVGLSDGSGRPLSGYEIAWAPLTSGGGVYAPIAITDANGAATTAVRPGLSVGAYGFRASFADIDGNTSSVDFTTNGTAPSATSVFAALNADHVIGSAGTPGAATIAQTSRVWSVIAAPDGTMYVDDIDHCRVLQVTQSGYSTVFAGNGQCGATFGVPATTASILYSRSMALDTARHKLYIADGYPGNTVRVVDLTTGILDLFAGTGLEAGPAYGDGGPATLAALHGPGGLAVLSDGSVLIVDGFGDTNGYPIRIRRVDPTGTIDSFLSPTTDCNVGFAINSIHGGDGGSGVMAVDPLDNLYFFATICGTSIGANGYAAVLRRSPAGTYAILAGAYNGSTADSGPASTMDISCEQQMALDPSLNIYYSDGCLHRVRRIDSTSAMVTTLVGTGVAGGPSTDYTPASGFSLRGPWGVAVLPSGHIAVGGGDNDDLDIIW